MPAFYGYSVQLLYERRKKHRDRIARTLHKAICPWFDYAGVVQDNQVSVSLPLDRRPAWKRLYDALRVGDCVVLMHLERCFQICPLTEVIDLAERLTALGIRVILADCRIDMGTEAGKTALRALKWANGWPDLHHERLASEIRSKRIV